jgi:hypothetical protein
MTRNPQRLPNYGIGSKGIQDEINLEDNEKINLGTNKDLSLYFDGTNLLIKNSAGTTIMTLGPTTGNLTLGGSGKQIKCSKIVGV